MTTELTGVNAGPGPATFISRFGLVRYNGHLPARYPRDWPCELGVCRIRRAADLTSAQARRQAAERRLGAIGRQLLRLSARHAELLAWRPEPGQERRQRRRSLDACRARLRELAAEAERITAVILPGYGMAMEQAIAPPAGRGAMLVFDHCHAHGWVRGLICMACNNALIRVEHGRGSVDRGAELAAVAAYLGNCPDCPRPQAPLG